MWARATICCSSKLYASLCCQPHEERGRNRARRRGVRARRIRANRTDADAGARGSLAARLWRSGKDLPGMDRRLPHLHAARERRGGLLERFDRVSAEGDQLREASGGEEGGGEEIATPGWRQHLRSPRTAPRTRAA